MLLYFLGALAVVGFAIWSRQGPKGPCPLTADLPPPVRPRIEDKKERNKVIKQRYSASKVPEDLDAIVVGSGISGLCSAALLAKVGKKVLVLEQHDQAGGNCHTFFEKGIEFDTGIHYIGEMGYRSMAKYLLDQISDGQIEWAPMDETFDQVNIGFDAPTSYHMTAGRGTSGLSDSLKQSFPSEHKGIDDFFNRVQQVRMSVPGYVALKTMPRWVAALLIKTGLVRFLTKFLRFSSMSLQDVLDDVTDNKDLQAALAYAFGDYGTIPTKAPFSMHAMLMGHYASGASYPVGGPSEISMNIIPVIERGGGKVLVAAAVQSIDFDGDRAVGVTMQRDGYQIRAPVVISAAGVCNTFGRLIPRELAARTKFAEKMGKGEIEHGIGCFSVYVGLEGSSEENGLPAKNFWCFKDADFNTTFTDFLALEPSTENCDLPLSFISFPSAKDPTYHERIPDKSCCVIVSLAKFEWFESWKDKRVMKRGEDYQALKMAFANDLWTKALKIFPHLEDKVCYFDVGTPLSNNHYLGQMRGATYGLDHSMSRLNEVDLLRPDSGFPGLFLTGQDIFTCGFVGAMFAGLLTTSSVLNRNLFLDLMTNKKKQSQLAKQQQ